MINTFKKSLLIAVACLVASMAQAVTIYESDLVQTGTNFTAAGQGSFSTPPSWGSAYSSCWKTGSSTHKTTLTFSPALSLSGYSNVQMTIAWGHTSSNKKMRVYVNGTEITTAIDGTLTATSANTLYSATVSITENTINTIAFQGAGSSGLTVLHFTITGDGGGGDSGGGDTGGGDTGGGDTGGGDTGGGDTGGGETPGTGGTVIFNWTKSGSNGFTVDMTNLNASDQGSMTVGQSIYGRKLGSNNVDSNTKGYKLGNNDVCIEIQGTSAFEAGDIVTIMGVCGGNGARAFAIAPETATNAATDTALTNTQENTSETLEYKVTVKSAQAGSKMRIFRMAGKTMYLSAIKVERSGSGGGGGGGDIPATPTVTSVSISPASATLEVNGTQQLTATVVASPDEAGNKNVTWTSSDLNVATVNESGLVTAVGAGTATITATSTIDNTKSATSAITVNAPSVIVPVEGVSLNISTTTTITVGETLNLIATINPSNATNKAVTWSSTDSDKASVSNTGVVTGIAVGSSIIKVTTVDGNFEAQCVVIVDPAPTVSVTGVSLNKHALGLQVGQSETLVATISPNNATNKAVSWSSSNSQIASVSNNGTVTGVAVGTATITVTTEDGNKTDICAVDVTAGTPVPPTTLSLHTPGVYEDETSGYGTPLVENSGREYEVYYFGKAKPNGSSDIATSYTKNKQDGFLVTTANGSTTTIEAADNWFKGNFSGLEGSIKAADKDVDQKAAARDEFATMPGDIQIKGGDKKEGTDSLVLHIKGYDQFSFVGRDGDVAGKDKMFIVRIDGDSIAFNVEKSETTRRFDITSDEHVIKISAKGSSNCKFYAFSLRLAQEPSVKWIKGNDSTQTIRATEAMRIPIQYQTKYNNLPGASTTIQWLGNEPTGITFDKISTASGALKDTFAVRGIANCPAGTYNYSIVSTFNGRETSRIPGSFSVYNEIRPSSNDSVLIFKDEEMDPVTFRYYAANENDVHLEWGANGKPDGITNKGDNGTYYISGTPTVTGFFPFSISIEGADTVFYGQLEIKDGSGADILFLYKNSFSGDGIYNYIKSKYSISERQAKKDGLRPASQYAKYKWVLISEDVDANNHEVIELVRGGSNNLPILNLKGFTYSKDSMRLGWGDPNNGAIDSAKTKNAGCSIILERAEHPIFKKLTNPTDGKSVKIIEDYKKNGIMPITINNMPGSTTCLATAYTRGENYYDLGPLQTAIHEIPSDQRGGKYICLPIARQVTLTTAGKQLIDGIIEYLLSPVQATIEAPELRIDTFTVAGINADIDEGEKTIKLKLTVNQFKELDSLRAAKPEIVLADPHSHVTPASGEEVNLQYSIFLGTSFEVTDYINRVVYEFKVQLINPQGIEEVYEAGQWVNVFDIFGRKIATTNEDIYSMSLPHGMYIVVTESGNTLKIMR